MSNPAIQNYRTMANENQSEEVFALFDADNSGAIE